MPFIRAASACSALIRPTPQRGARAPVWDRLAGDMKPAGSRTWRKRSRSATCKVFDDFINAKVTGRIVWT
jgi:hypothetical protein